MEIFDKVDKINGIKVPKPQLTEDDKRNVYLRNIALGVEQGPLTGYPSKDSVGLKYYLEDEIVEELPKISAYSYLYRNNIANSSDIALNYYGMKISYSELFEKIDETAKALKESGIEENDVITLMMPNTPEAVYLFYAASKIGATVQVIDCITDIDDIEKCIKASDSKMTFVLVDEYERIKPLVKDRTIKDAVVVSMFEPILLYLKTRDITDVLKDASRKDDFTKNTIRWNEFVEKSKNSEYLNAKLEFVPNRPLLIEHKKDASGDIKTVVLSNENINAVALQCSHSIANMNEQEKWLTVVPMSETTGVTMGIHYPLVNGFETSIIDNYDKNKFAEHLLKIKPNHVIASPSFWHSVAGNDIFYKKNLSNIVSAISSDFDVNTRLEKKVNNFLENHGSNGKFLKVFGTNELGGAIACTTPINNELGSVGIPFSKTKVGIFRTGTDEELGYNKDGEICVSGPSVINICNNLENTMIKKHEDGRVMLHTGYIGRVDENGNLYVADTVENWYRKKESLRFFEHKIQNVVANYWTIKGCEVTVDVDERHKDRKYTAYVVLEDAFKEYQEIVERQLISKCELEFPQYANLISFKFKDNIEEIEGIKNSTAKPLFLKRIK